MKKANSLSDFHHGLLGLEALDSLPEGTLPPPRIAMLLAQLGETDRMQRVVAAVAADQPKATLPNGVWLPLAKSVQALAANQPDVAVDVLRPAERYERRWSDIALQRGLAEMQRANDTAAVAGPATLRRP